LTNLEILTCLKKLNYKIIKFNKRVFEIDICENKKSVIQSEKEIIEEVGRIYGFNNL
jgi:phenylalanyl-tRNA synthetase beta subunit